MVQLYGWRGRRDRAFSLLKKGARLWFSLEMGDRSGVVSSDGFSVWCVGGLADCSVINNEDSSSQCVSLSSLCVGCVPRESKNHERIWRVKDKKNKQWILKDYLREWVALPWSWCMMVANDCPFKAETVKGGSKEWAAVPSCCTKCSSNKFYSAPQSDEAERGRQPWVKQWWHAGSILLTTSIPTFAGFEFWPHCASWWEMILTAQRVSPWFSAAVPQVSIRFDWAALAPQSGQKGATLKHCH